MKEKIISSEKETGGEQVVQTQTTRRRHRGVMNNVNEINQRADEVSKLSLFGASAMGFPDKISSVRAGMATRHASQRVVLQSPEFPIMFTGAENNFGKRSSWNIEAEDDLELIKIFPKFKNVKNCTTVYIFKNLRTGKYKCKVITPAVNLVEKYGFRMNNFMTSHIEGDILHAGDIIAQTSSYVNRNYCAGINVRCANAVLPELTEDALIISEDTAKRMAYNMVDVVTVNVSKNSYLLNKYGTNGEYKPFPDIGEEIKNDILCSIRENSYVSSVKEASIPHINDKKYFSKGTVVDISIFSNVEVENDQVIHYSSQIHEWYTNIYSYISTIISDKYQDDTSLLDIYHEAEKYLNKSTWVTKEYIADTIIKFTIFQPKEIRIGQKVVGRYGNKSVIAKIIPDNLMPKTADGRPIHMLSNALAVPNRIIAFQTYEQTLTFQLERMHQHMLKMESEGASKDDIIDIGIQLLSIYNPEFGEDTYRLYRENPDEVYNDIMTNGLYMQIPPLNEVCVRDAIIEGYEKFPDIMKRHKVLTNIKHKWVDRWVELDEEHAIGYQYMWVLKQEPSKSMSTVSTGRTTLYDLPVKTRKFNQNLSHYSDNPIKFGEYDTYNFLAGVGPRSFAKISTMFRGSQYEDNSVLMSQLNNMGVDMSKYNKFPQLDNLKNILKFMGIELKQSIYGYNTIGNIDEEQDIFIGNVNVRISIPDLRYILIMNSYYMQYEEYINGPVDMVTFFDKMVNETNLFDALTDEYVSSIFEKFSELFPILQQLKEYE